MLKGYQIGIDMKSNKHTSQLRVNHEKSYKTYITGLRNQCNFKIITNEN